MDPDNFTLIIDLDDDSDWDEEEEDFFSASRLESELVALRARLRAANCELDKLHVQAEYFNPMYPSASANYVQEVEEQDVKGSTRACQHRIRHLQAQISNLNRKVVSAKRAEASGLNVGRVLSVEERTLFVLGMGNDNCSPNVVRSMFKPYGDVEAVRMFKRHCLVTFTSKEYAHKALSINGTKPFGRRVRVRPKLEPFSSLPPTIPWTEPESFSFTFTFCFPRAPFPQPAAPWIWA